jgi:two-component system phosphate regulon response regulator PhoB
MEKGVVQYFGNGDVISLQLEHLLEGEGYALQTSGTLDSLQDTVLREKPAVIIIDLDEFGDRVWSTCMDIKDDLATRKAALMLLSASTDENMRVKGLESGADDIIAKPIGARELAARVKAISRRLASNDAKKIRVKDIEIDLDEHRVRKAGKPIDLTYIQFKLLYLLASRRNSVFSRKEILERVWGKKVYVTNRTVDVHIKRLREKLGWGCHFAATGASAGRRRIRAANQRNIGFAARHRSAGKAGGDHHRS